jgi:uncharacterized repeat protein (TIGR01451 family)
MVRAYPQHLYPIAFKVTFVLVLVVIGMHTLGAVRTAQAQTTANSSAFGEFVDLNLLPILGGGIDITSGPLPTASGTAPPAYTDSGSLASVSVSSLLTGQILQTGLLEVNAASTVPGSDNVSADATVNDLEILIVELLQLLTISANTVQSTADISGTCGDTLTATGTTTIEDATVGGTLGVGLSISVNPAPNTVLLNLSGITVILNEQIIGGDGVNSRSLTVNAIRISLDNVLLTAIGTLSGDIIISQSQAQLLCDEQTSAEANLSIIKSDSPDPVTVGDTLTYTLTITNNGPDTATNVVVTDTLPNSVTFNSAVPSQGSCSEAGGIVTCDLGNLANGAQATVTISVTPTSEGTILNSVTVISDDNDPDMSDNTDTEETTVEPVSPTTEADLSIIKSDSPDPVTVGDTLTYTLTITNNGPDSATNVVVTDTLPNSVTFVSAMASPGSCSESGGIVTCNLGNLAVGQAIVTITVIPTSVGTIFDTATVTSNTDDPDPSNNMDTEDTIVDPVIIPTPTPMPSPTPIPGPITVPTLSEWGIIITTVILGLLGAVSMWRRRAL